MNCFCNKIFRAFLLLILFAQTHIVLAQGGNVRGEVLDKSSRQKLEGASVRVEAMDSKSGSPASVTVSKQNGRFEISLQRSGFYNMYVSHIGYKTEKRDSIKIIAGIDVELAI